MAFLNSSYYWCTACIWSNLFIRRSLVSRVSIIWSLNSSIFPYTTSFVHLSPQVSLKVWGFLFWIPPSMLWCDVHHHCSSVDALTLIVPHFFHLDDRLLRYFSFLHSESDLDQDWASSAFTLYMVLSWRQSYTSATSSKKVRRFAGRDPFFNVVW